MKVILAGVIAICGIGAAGPAPAPGQSVQQLGESIRDRFVAAVRRCGVTPPFVPKVTVDPTKSIDVHYADDDRTVHLTDWANLDPDSRGAITAWSKQGTLGLGPEAMYREMFDSYIVPHELGHYLQGLSGRYQTLSFWDSELEANRIGVAFWSLQRGPEGDVAKRIANITGFTDALPDPVPAGEDEKTFFNRAYPAFSRGEDGPLNAMNYSWFQARLMKIALAERGTNGFCTLVKINAPRSATAR